MPIKVYYLDDEAALCQIFTEFFTSEKVQVITFTDPDHAIQTSKIDHPDIFFIDFRLPGITGDLVALAVDEKIEKVLVTGDLSVASEYKFKKIISKPYDFKLIQDLIDDFLE